MNLINLPSNNVSTDWLYFLAILLSIGIGIACFMVWFFMLRKGGKRKRKHRHSSRRQTNPTLAQTGGLPPMRHPDEPPKGV